MTGRKMKRTRKVCSANSDVQKHQRFKKMRADHYNMKAVLSHAKELLESEMEDENINDPNKYEVEEASTPMIETDSEDELSNNHTRNE